MPQKIINDEKMDFSLMSSVNVEIQTMTLIDLKAIQMIHSLVNIWQSLYGAEIY